MDYKIALELLNLDELEVSRENINRAYKAKASECHPDKATGSNKLMRELNEARDCLIRDLTSSHSLVTSKDFELAIARANQSTEMQRRSQVQASTFKVEAIAKATYKLHYLKNLALIFMAVAGLMLFLGKDLPKEFIMFFYQSQLSGLDVVEKPKTSKIIQQYEAETFKKNYSPVLSEGSKSDTEIVYTKKEKAEIDFYLIQKERYQLYQSYKINIDNSNKHITLIWYLTLFSIAGGCSAYAWMLNFKIKNVENLINEFHGDLQIRSNYLDVINFVFKGKVPNEWTFKQMQNALVDLDFTDNSLNTITYYLGIKKLCQILVLKGQEGGYLQMHEKQFDEVYSLIMTKK